MGIALLVAMLIVGLHGSENHRHYEHVPAGLRFVGDAFFWGCGVLPVAFLTALASFPAYPGRYSDRSVPRGPGTLRAGMFWLRITVLGSCSLVFFGSIFCMLRGSLF